MSGRPSLLSRLWQSEKGLSALLVCLVLALFVGAPLVSTGATGELVFDLFFSLLLLSGVWAVGREKLLTIGVTSLVLLTVAVRWSGFWKPGTPVGILYAALSILSLSILTGLVLARVFRDGPITSYRIQGAIAVYLLVGLIWTAAYDLLYQVLPGAFHFSRFDLTGGRLTHGLAYFSFVTLTTVGYGDITPVHPVARSLAMGEALVGQLYPAILIARLVSMQIASRRHQ